MGLSADDAVRLLSLPQPNYIKIDVDGIEHRVLSGASSVLTKADGVLIEINDVFSEQADKCNSLLSEAGLVLKEKRHAEAYDSIKSFGGEKVWNQVGARVKS